MRERYVIDYDVLDNILDGIGFLLETMESFEKYHANIPELLRTYLNGETFKSVESTVEQQCAALSKTHESLEELYEILTRYKNDLSAELEEELPGPLYLEIDVVEDVMKAYQKIIRKDISIQSDELNTYISNYESKIKRFRYRVNTIDFDKYDANETAKLKGLISQKEHEIDKFYANKSLYENIQQIIESYNHQASDEIEFIDSINHSLERIDDIEKEAYQIDSKLTSLVFNLTGLGTTYTVIKKIGSTIKENPWIMDTVHLGLNIGGMVPGIGWMCDSANAGLYLCEGDYVNAAFSAASVVPGVAMAAYTTKGFKTIDKVSDFKNLMTSIEKGESASKILVKSKRGENAKDMIKFPEKSRKKPRYLKTALEETEYKIFDPESPIALKNKFSYSMKIKKKTDFSIYLSGVCQSTSELKEWINTEKEKTPVNSTDITFDIIDDYYINTWIKGFQFLF